jgi:hypothetical protein
MVGKYYSHEWLRKNILQQTDDDIEEMDAQINEEIDSGDERWKTPEQQMMDQQMMAQEGETGQSAPAGDEDVAVDPKHDEQTAKMQQAKATYDLLSQKKNMTLSDEAKLKSATQILAKNK